MRLYLGLVLAVCSVYHAAATLIELPQNVVSVDGTTVTLRCVAAASPAARVMWTEFATAPTGVILSDNRNVVPTHPNSARYTITGGTNEYHLEIRNASLADGGRYLCQDIQSSPPDVNQGSAELVVIAGDPVCTDIVTVTGVVIEGRFYTLECDIRYRGNIIPNMTWTGVGQYDLENSITEAEVWSKVSFFAVRDLEGGQFVLLTRFVLPDNLPPGSATNTPDYQNTFFGSVLIVTWGPQDMMITPRLPQYQVGDVLNCTADAKPRPTYQWSNLRTQEVFPIGQIYTVTADLVGTDQTMRCNANSLIEGNLYNADVFVNITVPAITTTTTPGPTTPSTPPPADGPCRDLTGQWTSTNPNALLCIEMDTKGNILTLMRNGTDPFFVTGRGKTVYNDYKHIGFSGLWPPNENFGVGGFVGECHNCFGNEILLMSGLARNKFTSVVCGASAGTRVTNLYAFTRFGPPCRNLDAKVYRPSEEHVKLMDIRPENIMS